MAGVECRPATSLAHVSWVRPQEVSRQEAISRRWSRLNNKILSYFLKRTKRSHNLSQSSSTKVRLKNLKIYLRKVFNGL